MNYIKPKISDKEREESRARLDILMAKSVSVSKKIQHIVRDIGFPKIGGLENIVGPPLTWLGNCTGKNYMGSEKMFPMEFLTHKRNPNYQTHHVKRKIGRLLRQCYRKYLSPLIQQQKLTKNKNHFRLDLETDHDVIRNVFCSFKRCREALEKGKLDNLMISILKHYRRLISDLGFSMFLFLWDQSHMMKPEHPALQKVPLFHSEYVIDKDNPMFSSYNNEFSKDFGESIKGQKFNTLMKKVARQCVMDSWNIATRPYEKTRCLKFCKNATFLPVESDISIDEESSIEERGHSTVFSRNFGMTADELKQYDTQKRSEIVCMLGFSILQTTVIRAVLCHEMQRILPEEMKKSNVGLYLHAFNNTICDLSFQLLCQSSCIEEFTDVYLEQCGIYKMLYPHGKRFVIAHELIDMTNLLNDTSIWRDVKTGKANEISKLEHLFLGKMLHQKCKIRNVRKMITDETEEHPIMTYLMRDNIYMTLSGGYPVCGNRPSLPAQILVGKMASSFATKPYSYFLDWVETNRRMIFSSGKEFFFYQLAFIPPIRDLMIDTMLFERHETGIRNYLDKFRDSLDDIINKEAINYMNGYEPERIKESLPPRIMARRLVDVYVQDNSTYSGRYGTTHPSSRILEIEEGAHTNDMELTIQLVAAGPNAVDPDDALKLRNQVCFLNSTCDKINDVMIDLNDMGDESHNEQQDNYNKLVKKPFSDEIATRTRTLIPQGLSEEERELFIREKIEKWNDAMIIVWLEQEVLAGRIILNSDWTEWEKARPQCMKKFRTKKQKIRMANFLSFHAIKTSEWEWDRNHRRPRLIDQALNDYLDQLDKSKKLMRKGQRGIKLDSHAESFHQDIKVAAETASLRKDGWYDFMTWMRVLGISRFGRQMLKTLYFQYEKCEIPDNRFATYTEILFSIRPRDFQIIREFAACYENAPNIRIVPLGPLVAKNQLEALRKRFGLEMLDPPPHDIGLSYYCATCGNWADVKMSPESKGFKMYGIGLEDAVLDCLTDTLHCKRQGTAMCLSDEPLRTIDTIGVAVSIGDRKPVTRCATCGALTYYTDGNFTELGPTCGGHTVPEHIVRKRPGNGSLKKNLISLDEVIALDTLRKNRMFSNIDKRKPIISCYYCSKEITSKSERVKTIKLCYDPKPYDPMVASFRSWMDRSVVGDNRFPVSTKISSAAHDQLHTTNNKCRCLSICPEELPLYEKGSANIVCSPDSSSYRKNLKRPRISRENIIIVPCKKHKNLDVPKNRSNWGFDRTFQPPDDEFLMAQAKPKINPLRPSPLFITVPLCDPCLRVCKFWLRNVVMPTTDVFMKWMSKKMKKKHMARADAICSVNSIQVAGGADHGGTKYIKYK